MHVEVRGLNKHFGNFHAVKDVSFDIQAGHLIGLLGPSGGGKLPFFAFWRVWSNRMREKFIFMEKG